MLEDFDEAARDLIAKATWAPAWVISLIVLAVSLLPALVAHRIIFRIVSRLVEHRDLFWRSLVQRTEGPTRLALVVVALSVGASLAPLTLEQTGWMRHILAICFIWLCGWVALTALHIWTTVYLRKFKLDSEDNLLARKHTTQSRILKRVAGILIVVITVSATLMTFDGVRQYGVSLLASAGAAGLVLGLAMQPVLKNLISGVQLAVTQPIRLEDAVIVEGEWGNIEEITSTYVVVRLWDWRRMVLPLTYFLEKPFQNWTRESASLIGTVMIYVDYSAPVAEMRAQFDEVVRGSKLWDRQVMNMQVTDFKAEVMEVRMLMSASSGPRTFDLRCEVREKMIAWLQAEHPTALPRQRAQIGRLPHNAAWVDSEQAGGG